MAFEVSNFELLYRHPDSSRLLVVTDAEMRGSTLSISYNASDAGLDPFHGYITLTNGVDRTERVEIDQNNYDGAVEIDIDSPEDGHSYLITANVTDPDAAFVSDQWEVTLAETVTDTGEPSITNCSVGGVDVEDGSALPVSITASNPTDGEVELFYTIKVDGDQVENESVVIPAGGEERNETTIRASRLPLGEDMPVTVEKTNLFD